MRLFIAIQFEKNIIDALTEIQGDLRIKGVKGNYTKPENLHITLAFIGEYGNPDDIIDAMEQVPFSPMKISMDGVGRFGELFWVGLSENPELASYVKRLRRELAARDIPYDRKKFSPHITLIRKLSYRDGNRLPVDAAPEGSMTATRVSLMLSERGKNGMIYTEIGGVDAV